MGWLSKGAGGKAPQGRQMPARGSRGTSILSEKSAGGWRSLVIPCHGDQHPVRLSLQQKKKVVDL